MRRRKAPGRCPGIPRGAARYRTRCRGRAAARPAPTRRWRRAAPPAGRRWLALPSLEGFSLDFVLLVVLERARVVGDVVLLVAVARRESAQHRLHGGEIGAVLLQ